MCSSATCDFTLDRGSNQVIIAEAEGPVIIDPSGCKKIINKKGNK
jgi:hypothetical protein